MFIKSLITLITGLVLYTVPADINSATTIKNVEIAETVKNKLIAPAWAYCWKNRSGNYKCYGPTQLLSTYYRDLDKALRYSGCKGARQMDRWGGGYGVRYGVAFKCTGTELRSYHTSPQEIADWVERNS